MSDRERAGAAPPPPPPGARRDDYDDDGGSYTDGSTSRDRYYDDEEEYYSDEYSDEEYSDEEYSDEEYSSEGTAEEPARRGRYTLAKSSAAPPVELPNRATPAEIWQAKRTVVEPPKPPVKMRSGDFDKLVERLNDRSRLKHVFLMRAECRQTAEELSGLSFAPRICKESKRLAAHNRNLAERTDKLMSARARRINDFKDEREQELLNTATFRPDLKTPCVCGKGKGLRESTEGELKGHTTFCQNFMKACESLNRSSRMQQMSDRLERRVAHLAEYEANKRLRAQQRRQCREEEEARELTFAPQINQKSLEIMERKMREAAREAEMRAVDEAFSGHADAGSVDGASQSGSRYRSLLLSALRPDSKRKGARRVETVPVSKQHELPGHEEETFRPAINPRSQAIPTRGDSDVYSRLYASATSSMMTRKAKIVEKSRKYVNTNVDEADGLDLGVAFQVDVMKTAGLNGPPSATSGGTPSTTAPDYFNAVPYSTKLDFIVRRLQG